jgi:hypothetical protein
MVRRHLMVVQSMPMTQSHLPQCRVVQSAMKVQMQALVQMTTRK